MIGHWQTADGTREYALVADRGRTARFLIVPPFFDELNKMRRLLAEIMRRLDAAGVDAMLPDLPGTNESRAALHEQTREGWRQAIAQAATQFRATHVLAVRAGAVLAPNLPGWAYAPLAPEKQLRTLLRSRVLNAREAGREEDGDLLRAMAREDGIVLAGYDIGAPMFNALHAAEPAPHLATIAHGTIGGTAPWLRAEPGYDAAQADALAAVVAMGVRP
jgi:hypothetical protein